MASETVKFKRGTSDNLPETKTAGTILVETDTGVLYVDDSDSNRVQIKDPTKSKVSFSSEVTSGNEIGTITIDGVDNKIYTPNNDEYTIGINILDVTLCTIKDSITKDGIIVTSNHDGTFTVNGINNTNANIDIYLYGSKSEYNNPSPLFTLPEGNWVLSGCPGSGSANTYCLKLSYNYAIDDIFPVIDIGNGTEITSEQMKDISDIYGIYVRIAPGCYVDRLVFKPMICSKEEYEKDPTYRQFVSGNIDIINLINDIKNSRINPLYDFVFSNGEQLEPTNLNDLTSPGKWWFNTSYIKDFQHVPIGGTVDKHAIVSGKGIIINIGMAITATGPGTNANGLKQLFTTRGFDGNSDTGDIYIRDYNPNRQFGVWTNWVRITGHEATQELAGLMSAEDKIKLDKIDMTNIQSQINSKLPIKRCGVSGEIGSDIWVKVAETTINALYNTSYNSVFDVDDISNEKTTGYGRLSISFKATLNGSATEGGLDKDSIQFEWVYNTPDIIPEEYVLAYKNETNTSVNLQLWTKLHSNINYKHFIEQYYGCGPYYAGQYQYSNNNWTLYGTRETITDFPGDFEIVYSSPSTMIPNNDKYVVDKNMLNTYPTLSKQTTISGVKFVPNNDGTITVTGKNTSDSQILCKIWDANDSDMNIPTAYLPEEYQQIEFIESTGTQYIDTGVIPKIGMKFVVDFYYSNGHATDDMWFMGAVEDSFTKGIEGGIYYNKFYDEQGVTYNVPVTDIQERFIATADINMVKFECTKCTCCIFTRNTPDGVSTGVYGRCYNVSIFDGTTLTHYFVPCYRKSDMTVGMFDLVNQTFISDGNGGNFRAGKATASETIPLGTYTISGCPSGGSAKGYGLMVKCSDDTDTYVYGTNTEITVLANKTIQQIFISIAPQYEITEPLLFKPMVCNKEKYAESPSFCQYALGNVELTRKLDDFISDNEADDVMVEVFGEEAFVPNRDFEYVRSGDGGIEIIGYKNYSQKHVYIPEEIEGLPVTSINTASIIAEDGYYHEHHEIESVIIPNTVTSIGTEAFYGCTNLKYITIPNSVTSIGRFAFADCASLESITIPNGVTSIADAFYGCTNLKSVTIPNSVTSIASAFAVCTSLTTITIPNSVTSIVSAFTACTNLKHITIPSSVTSISYAFRNCINLESVTISNGITKLDYSIFEGCINLKSVKIPDSVTEIGNSAFQKWTGLESITIPDSVTTIGMKAFENCTNLKSITIPSSVTNMGTYVFKGCTSLESVIISSPKIGQIAFADCIGLTSVTITDSVTIIGNSAFSGCTGLTSVTIPNSVTSIEGSAFGGCTNLKSITILGKETTLDSNVVPTATTIRGYKGSPAEEYAKKYGNKFEAID